MCRYLGLYTKEIDAAQAYDRESVKRKGLKAITNFDISEYLDLLSESSETDFVGMSCLPAFRNFVWQGHLIQIFCGFPSLVTLLPTIKMPLSLKVSGSPLAIVSRSLLPRLTGLCMEVLPPLS